MTDQQDRTDDFLAAPLHVVNVGLDAFASDLERQGVGVISVDWSPPASGNAKLADLLSKLES